MFLQGCLLVLFFQRIVFYLRFIFSTQLFSVVVFCFNKSFFRFGLQLIQKLFLHHYFYHSNEDIFLVILNFYFLGLKTPEKTLII